MIKRNVATLVPVLHFSTGQVDLEADAVAGIVGTATVPQEHKDIPAITSVFAKIDVLQLHMQTVKHKRFVGHGISRSRRRTGTGDGYTVSTIGIGDGTTHLGEIRSQRYMLCSVAIRSGVLGSNILAFLVATMDGSNIKGAFARAVTHIGICEGYPCSTVAGNAFGNRNTRQSHRFIVDSKLPSIVFQCECNIQLCGVRIEACERMIKRNVATLVPVLHFSTGQVDLEADAVAGIVGTATVPQEHKDIPAITSVFAKIDVLQLHMQTVKHKRFVGHGISRSRRRTGTGDGYTVSTIGIGDGTTHLGEIFHYGSIGSSIIGSRCKTNHRRNGSQQKHRTGDHCH